MKFGTVEVILNWNSTTIVKGVQTVVRLYRYADFQVMLALMDGEFSPSQVKLMEESITLNEPPQNEDTGDF